MYKWLFASRISQAQFHEYVLNFNKLKIFYTNEIAMCAKALTNRKCTNGYSIGCYFIQKEYVVTKIVEC